MGYRKWRLGAGDAYQLAVAKYQAVRMLQVYAKDIEGPLALACESPVDGWDDIVEFGSRGGVLCATHYQVKQQQTDFEAGDLENVFMSLFRSAAEIFQNASPYHSLAVLPKNRSFIFVLPGFDVAVGKKFSTGQLDALLKKCATAESAGSILGNDGALIVDGREKGDQQRMWLAEIRKAVACDIRCMQLLPQVSFSPRTLDSLKDCIEPILRELFDQPEFAALIIGEALGATPPEGHLDAGILMEKLGVAGPKRALKRVKLANNAGRWFLQSQARQEDPLVVAKQIVRDCWSPHHAQELHFGCPPPSNDKELGLSCVRLLLHAQQTPVYVTSRDQWRDLTKRRVADVVGFASNGDLLGGAHFEEKSEFFSLPPVVNWSPQELGTVLRSAMDCYIWDKVIESASRLLEGVNGVDCAEIANSMKRIDDFFDWTLRGWWQEEKGVSGIVRAGPCAVHRLATILAGVAVLRYIGYQITIAASEGGIGKIGEIHLRALAIEVSNGIVGDRSGAVPLDKHAQEIVAFSGIVLLPHCSVDDYYQFARMPRLDRIEGAAGIQDSTATAFLIDPSSLVSALSNHGGQAARDMVNNWCATRASDHRIALDAACQQWRESDAA